MTAFQDIPVHLTFTARHYGEAKDFLFSGDGKEAVVIALCSRRAGSRRHRLLVREIIKIPYENCPVRSEQQVTWNTDAIIPILERADEQGLSIVKIHCHPNGFPSFSETDDRSDQELFRCLPGWIDGEFVHGSAVMLPDGQLFGRAFLPNDHVVPISTINVVGDDLLFWYHQKQNEPVPDFAASHAQVFGEGTTERLRRLSVAVIGCSGTGGLIIEQLLRHGTGEVIGVDPDYADFRNLNRMLNCWRSDAKKKISKPLIYERAALEIDSGTRFIPICKNLWDPGVVEEVAQADIIFGTVDTVDARHLINKLATYYLIPYIDLGVCIDVVPEGKNRGEIREICGSVHYLQPGLSSLISREAFLLESVRTAGLARTNPDSHAQQVKEGYIKGVPVQRPAVMPLNMYAASLGFFELLGRLHPFREESNHRYAHIEFSLTSIENFLDAESEFEPDQYLAQFVGAGDVSPMLRVSELSRE